MDKIQDFLDRNGCEYLFGFRMSALFFVVLEVILAGLALVIGLVGIRDGMICILLIMGSLFLLPGMLLLSNQADNDAMLVDIKHIFEMLKIQVRVGIYMMDALDNCLCHIQNKRLKKALNKLITQVFMAKDMNLSLDEFNHSFHNIYIDTLVVIIKQSLETGYSMENLNNAFEQIADVEQAINIRMENSIERNTQILQVLLMSGIIAISVYCSFVEFQNLFQFY